MTSDLRRWMNAVSPLTTLTEAAAIPTLYRGFGSGKGQRYKGKEWGDAVYLTSDLQIATWYGQQGGVKRAHVPRLHVISASDAMTEQIADSVSPSTTARRLGVDAIYNASKHWVNRISPYEFILFAKDQVSFSPLSSEETAEYDRVKALLSEAPRDLRRWIMLCERWETLGEAAAKSYIGYHATPAKKIVNFSLKMSPGGIYFASTPGNTLGGGERMIVAEITFNNPYETTDRRTVQHSDAEQRESVVRAGYDGMVWIGDDGEPIEIVAFVPQQINILKQGRTPRKHSDPDGLLMTPELRRLYGVPPITR